MWDSRWWRNVHRQLIVCRETWKVPPRKFRACPDCDVIDDAVTWFCGLSICSLQFCLLFWHSMHSKHKVLWLDTIGWVLDKTFHLLQYHCSSLKRFFWTFGVQLSTDVGWLVNLHSKVNLSTDFSTLLFPTFSHSILWLFSSSVLFNLFFEVELFAAILIAHLTHGLSQKFVLRHREIRSRRPRAGKKFMKRDSKLVGLGECCKLPQWGSGQSIDHKCILDTLGAQKMCKCRLIPISWFDSAEPFSAFRFRRTPVEKHCSSLNLRDRSWLTSCLLFSMR